MPEPASLPSAPATSPAGGPQCCDVLVVGGGINGVGIARDLAGRGLKVVLCEKDDLARHTSSASTKLIHGGLRYLEQGEFSLVRKALAEREVLLRSAPHIMKPLRFVLPHDAAMRPAWMIRAGLFLYDHLARRDLLPGSHGIDLRRHVAGMPLKPRFTRGFVYSDVWVDDARLVVLNALDAAERGARVLNYCLCRKVERTGDAWQATLQHADGSFESIRARALVNATGPWAQQFLVEQVQLPSTRSLRLVRGSHIVVRRLFAHDHAYLFQNPDGRILFAIPYEHSYTLIGTTDTEHRGTPGDARMDVDELNYLCRQASACFARPIDPGDVLWSYSGVRPLIDDRSCSDAEVSRDYQLELDTRQGAPLLNVWSGKITTYRRLAEEAADRLCRVLRKGGPGWTRTALLPGGDLDTIATPPAGLQSLQWVLGQTHPELPPALLRAWAARYGTRVRWLLETGHLGREIAPGVYEAEMRYLQRHEFARCAEDVLWRRTKLGLHLDEGDHLAVRRWWAQQAAENGLSCDRQKFPEHARS